MIRSAMELDTLHDTEMMRFTLDPSWTRHNSFIDPDLQDTPGHGSRLDSI